jgi:hypothetical protein
MMLGPLPWTTAADVGEKEDRTMARKRTKPPVPSPEQYPHIARWCNQYGRIEIGYEWQDKLFARALHEGGLAWGGEGPYPAIDDALRALEKGIRDYMQKNGWQ